MDSLELQSLLNDLEITEGYAIRNGLIVLWENETPIPKSLSEYVQLDVNK